MAELFDYKQDHWSPELRSIGFHLGKYLYLLDAYDDLERDQAQGRLQSAQDPEPAARIRRRDAGNF